VLDLKWAGGTVHFTTDSRVLVAEYAGPCTWYKLPSGERDGGWDFGAPKTWKHEVTSASADGSVLAYIGALDRRPESVLLNGKTGVVLQRFKATNSSGAPVVSADGRRAAVAWTDNKGIFTVAAIDVRTGAVLGEVPTASGLVALGLAPDGSALALATQTAVQVYDLPGAGAAVVGPPPAVPPVPDAPVELKVRREIDVKKKGTYAYFDRDGQSVIVVSTGAPSSLTAFDARTGVLVRDFPKLTGDFCRLFPLEKGKIGFQTYSDRQVTVWDPATDKRMTRPVQPPAGLVGNTPFLALAPNGLYQAVGLNDPGPATEHPESELQFIDVTTGKPLFATKWRVGTVLFTADSSRALVVSDDGTFRRLKLPGGQVEGEWSFGLKSDGFNAREVAMSGDGAVVLYNGQPPGKERTDHLLDGKTGAVIHSFPAKRYLGHSGSVSEDGRFVALIRNDGFGTGHTIEILDVGGKMVASVKIPNGSGNRATPTISWRGQAVAMYDRNEEKVTLYDLPDFLASGAGGVAVVPKPPDPRPPAPDPGIPELKAKWSVEPKVRLDAAVPYFDDDGQALALVATAGPPAAAAFKPRTGEVIRELPASSVKGRFHALFPLDRGKFAIQTDADKNLLVWDTARALPATKAFNAPVAAAGVPYVNVSPNQQYVAVGNARPAPGAKSESSQLKVYNTTIGLSVVTTNWHVGTTAFTPDSTRLLVVDDTDKFRWFKLPKGEPDGEWAFNRTSDGRNAGLMGMSADGKVLLYHGQPPGKELTVHVLDGKDGSVLQSLPAGRYLGTGGSVSDDGKFVALLRNDGAGPGHTLELLDAHGTRLQAVRLPADAATAVSWKARVVVVYDRTTRRLTAYEMPAAPAP
jgi:WD40 repeat protein